MSRMGTIGFALLLAVTGSAALADRSLVFDLTFVISGSNLEWPGANTKNIYKTSGRYAPRNIIATRNQIYKDEAIVVFPRWKPGVPITLGLVKLTKKGSSGKPVVSPFPSWALQEEGNCKALQNVVDIVLDVQDIVWVLDVGTVNTLEKSLPYCSPKVVAINVRTGKVLKSIDLRMWISPASRLQYLAVDYAKDGGIFLYISDASTRAIIVYDVAENRGFRVVLPKAVTQESSHRDVLYLSLLRKNSGASVLYFTYLSSNRMYSIKVENLRSGAASSSITDVGPKHAKIVILGTDDGSAIFFRKKGHSDIFMWNVETKFSTENFILVQKGNDNRLPTQVAPGYKRLMWVLESNFHDYLQNTVGCPGPSVLLHPLLKSAEYL
ncbi:major royal jelly protein 1 [Venturia canescens]|uniref:major royal jelly protein 1 n=1 Tax=Venturia canescens TaxID=32260 RepID=UPI001C9CC1F0|nr:major royal jelly protein 1 [Venturia canescens]